MDLTITNVFYFLVLFISKYPTFVLFTMPRNVNIVLKICFFFFTSKVCLNVSIRSEFCFLKVENCKQYFKNELAKIGRIFLVFILVEAFLMLVLLPPTGQV